MAPKSTRFGEPDDDAGVANGHERDSFAARTSSLADGWARLPPASGAECCWALRRAGLQARLDGPDHVLIRRGRVPIVRVPLVDRFRPELLAAILKTVGVTPAQFTAYLDYAKLDDRTYADKRCR